MSVGDTIICKQNELMQIAEDLIAEGYGVNILFDSRKIVIVSLPERGME